MTADSAAWTLDTQRLAMTCSLAPWDCDLLGFAVGQIERMTVRDIAGAQEDFAEYEQWRDRQGVKVVSCRLDHGRLRESMVLESRGFRFVEMMYQPYLANVQACAFPEARLAIGTAGEDDKEEIADIARNAFATGRYALDWRLDPEINGRRYAGWVLNSFAAPSHRVLKAVEDGRIVGFFLVEDLPGRRCYWHLTAIADGCRGRGIGRRMWQAIVMLHKAEGVEKVETLVSGHNLPVINLYCALGFRFQSAQMTFHWLREE